MDYYALEGKDAVRMSWNVLPPSKLALQQAQIPLGCIYTPMKDIENLLFVEYKPQTCKCQAILNPFCKVDYKAKLWLCCFCNNRNPFPKEYAENISEASLPAELMQDYSTMEYLFPNQQLQSLPASIYMFVIDTSLPPEELQAIKDAILQAIPLLAPETWVGLVTFGKFAFIHELSATDFPRSYTFKGDKDYTTQQVLEILALSGKNDPRGSKATGAIKKFVMPISECESVFTTIIETLQPDPWEVARGERALRCTGTALSIATSLLESSYPGQGSRILSFIGGPCTYGPGQLVDLKLEEPIRSWMDIDKANEICKHVKKATKYYQSITERAIKNGQTIDIFAFTLDQFGLLEMRSLSEKTGGITITHELFDGQVFKDTFKKVFDRDANGDFRFGFCAELTLNLSKDLRVAGAIGPCTSLKKSTPLQADLEIGESGTNLWYLGGLDRNGSIAFFLDLPANIKDASSQQRSGYIQFLTKYRHSNGSYRLRVTTLARRFAMESNNPANDIAQGFDQEAGCLLLARLAVLKSELESSVQVIRWIDRMLIKVATKFGQYNQNDAGSFRLPKEFSLFPQFMFHLRRSNFIQTSACSPDESIYFRAALCRETTTNCMVMIQPSLLMYTFDNPEPQPVVLDIASLQDKVILLLDTYFDVVVWKGELVHKWEKAGYQDQPEYENFRTLLQLPLDDANLVIEDRYPAPTFFMTFPGHTKERKVKSRVNPSQLELDNATCQSGDFINDDASLQVFMSHLIKVVVATPRS